MKLSGFFGIFNVLANLKLLLAFWCSQLFLLRFPSLWLLQSGSCCLAFAYSSSVCVIAVVPESLMAIPVWPMLCP